MPSARSVLLTLALLASLTLTPVSPAAARTAPVAAQAGASAVTVLTFNVCGNAAGCGSWSKRESAVVQRIVGSGADVVNIQEGWGALPKLELRLARHGYVAVASNGNEGMFAKASTLSPVTTSSPVTSCEYTRIPLGPEVDTTGWNPSGHTDANGFTWFRGRGGVWYRNGETCTTEIVETAKKGEISMGGRAGAAWAMLRVKRTNKTYLFVSAHLTTGKDKVARKRSTETSRLLTATWRVAEGRPRVFGGDFNSSIQRGKDTVGKRFSGKGFTDASTNASSHRATKYNTATGYGRKPRVGGSHIDRVFVPRGTRVKRWSMDVKVRGGKSVRPIPSDHSPVRVSLLLR